MDVFTTYTNETCGKDGLVLKKSWEVVGGVAALQPCTSAAGSKPTNPKPLLTVNPGPVHGPPYLEGT